MMATARNLLSILSLFVSFQIKKHVSRERILSIRERRFRKLLHYVWHHSPFYRRYYEEHGIKAKDLPKLQITDLPFTDKALLIDHFDEIVTVPGLKRSEIDHWLATPRPIHERYLNKYLVLHSSGSSGKAGTYVYPKSVGALVNAYMLTRVAPEVGPLLGKKSYLFFGVTDGFFPGFTLFNSGKIPLVDKLGISLSASPEDIAAQLAIFKPDVIISYSSALIKLAKLQLAGLIDINPQYILISAEPITPFIDKISNDAWSVHPLNSYICSESFLIACQHGIHHDLVVSDDYVWCEILNNDNQEVNDNEEGRVVITNLYNRVMPVIRYELNDIAIKCPLPEGANLMRLRKIAGRTIENINIQQGDDIIAISPTHLTTFYIKGMKQIQFAYYEGSQKIDIHYVAAEDKAAVIADKFKQLLSDYGVKDDVVTVDIVREEEIGPEANGKTPLVKIIKKS